MSITETGLNPRPPIDEHLDDVAIKQLVWKNRSMALVAVRICNRALANSIFYPDEIEHDGLPKEDCNCTGSVFRLLAGRKLGVIERTTTFRRSEAEGRRGSTVFGYSIKSRAKAQSLVRHLGAQAAEPQKELF